MVFTLALINKAADFSKLPGFERLSGMIALLAVSFIIILILYKTRIFIGFFGSFEMLLVLGIVIYIFLTWSWDKLSGKKRLVNSLADYIPGFT